MLQAGDDEGAQFLSNTLLKSLQSGSVELPVPDETGKGTVVKRVPIAELGISCPVIVSEKPLYAESLNDPTREFEPGDKRITLQRFDFIVQFCWQETPPSKRREKEKAAKAAAAQTPPAEQPPTVQ